MAINRALVSVSNKDGVVDLARSLFELGIEIISTGGTAKAISDAGIDVVSITQVTDFPEMLEGRVKTLHPNIHAGILADRTKPAHMKALEEMNIKPIDLVVINLYPFVETVKKPGVTEADAIENIDIGGPAMIRASAKNFNSVAIVTDPNDYDSLLGELRTNGKTVSLQTRRRLAEKAFSHTAEYDGAISRFFSGGASSFADAIHLTYRKVSDLRYGENPHQKGALYRDTAAGQNTLLSAKQLHGKELSYNNVLDLEAAWLLANEWDEPACVIIKHNNPCGVAVKNDQLDAYLAAFESDPVSAFGGVMAFNTAVEKRTIEAMKGHFVEAIIAPGFEREALDILMQKKDLRIMKLNRDASDPISIRNVSGGALVQEADIDRDPADQLKVATSKKPSESELSDMKFAVIIGKHVKSNSIVLAKNMATVGIGAGQMSRLDSAYVAVRKAGDRAKGAVLASDAFFPFPDALEVCIEAGITGAIQPGGSVKDSEVINVAELAGISMMLTGRRHFRH